MEKRIFVASDHAGVKMKAELLKYLKEKGYEAVDMGTDSEERCDYPDCIIPMAERVVKENASGIAICGTGIGSCISANKVKGARAALCHSEYDARLSRMHNNSNILCLGGRTIGTELAKSILSAWLKTPFSNEERHKRRIEKIASYEEKVGG